MHMGPCLARLRHEDVAISPLMSDDGADKLSSLLDEEYLLLRIFGHLVKEELPECRLVCRKWYEVSNELLRGLRWLEPQELQMASKRFPNAIQLSTMVQAGAKRKGVTVVDVFHSLASFRNLADLTVHVFASYGKGAADASYFHLLRKLVSLDLRVIYGEASPAFYSSLRFLTGLTSLKLSSRNSSQNSIQPFTELERIQSLEVGPDMLSDDKGHLLFPSLTNLRSLVCSREGNITGLKNVETLQVIRPYASTLVSLCVCGRSLERAMCWPLLKNFTMLESLCVPCAVEQDVQLFPVVENMSRLTELSINAGYPGSKCSRESLVADVVFAPTQLRSLTLYTLIAHRPDGFDAFPFERLTRLTKLVTDEARFGSALTHLTGLLELEIDIYTKAKAEVFCSLESMPLLERLRITNYETTDVPERVFSHLEHLKSLSLTLVHPRESFFPTLASLNGLTHLEFFADMTAACPCKHFSGLQLLKSLKRLTLSMGPVYDPLDYLIEGCLPDLMELFLADRTLSYRDTCALKDRFPLLRTLTDRSQEDLAGLL